MIIYYRKECLNLKILTDIQEKLKRGILEMLILQLLSEEDMYAYQLKSEMNKRSGEYLLISELVLYPPLKRMLEKGYISERKEIVCKKRVRVYYHLEQAGAEYLDLLCKEYINTAIGVKKIMKWEDDIYG